MSKRIGFLCALGFLAFTACSGSSGGRSSGKPEITSVSGGGVLTALGGVVGQPEPVPGLSVRFSTSAVVPADQGYVAVLPSPRNVGPFGPEALSTDERKKIVEALGQVGIKPEDVQVESSGGFGPFPSIIKVAMPIDQIPSNGQKVIDAIEKVTPRSSSSGASFGLKDCGPALAPLRKTAFEGVQARAQDLGATAGVTPGALVSLRESTGSASGPEPSSDPCQPGSAGVPGGPFPRLEGFDAKPEVTINLNLEATYALGDSQGNGITATGSGTATTAADEAYLVVRVPSQGEFGPTPLSGKERQELISAVADLGYDAADIFVSGQFGAAIVQVETDLEDLEEKGKKLQDAAEEVLGRADASGVLFSHSNCKAVQLEAWKAAFQDAKTRATSMAEAGNLKLGAIRSTSELNGASPYGSAIDPCSKDPNALAAAQGLYGTPLLAQFDAKPEFKLETALAVSYTIG